MNKLVIDVSVANVITDSQWDYLATFVDGVVVKVGYGYREDAAAQRHIDNARRVGIVAIGYFWADPTLDFQKQLNNVIALIRKFELYSIIIDAEQYWTDWEAWSAKDYNTAYATRFTSEQLNTFYHKFYLACKQWINIPIGMYTRDSFMDVYSPLMLDWLPQANYWEAHYLTLLDTYDPDEICTLAKNMSFDEGSIGRQFAEYLQHKGEPEPAPHDLDWSAFTPTGFMEMFGGRELPVTFFSQLGEGASDHNNDCGLAFCSMATYAIKGNVVNVDDWYQMGGWHAPNGDVGTYAWQLVEALGIFEINSIVETTLTIDVIHRAVDAGQLICPLVAYSYFSNAGLTQFTGSFNHWFAIIGYDKDNIIILDPYRTDDGRMIVPNQLLLNSYLGSYLICLDSVQGEMPMPDIDTTNAAVNCPEGINVRSNHPDANGKYASKVGSLQDKRRITIDRTSYFKDIFGDYWCQLKDVYPGNWVYMPLVNRDVTLPPPIINENEIRVNENKKTIALLRARNTELLEE